MIAQFKGPLRFVRNYLMCSEARYCVHRSLARPRGLPSSDTPEGIRKHIDAAIGWILHAQELQPDGGVTSHLIYPGRKVVARSYPEVTGYIITTMIGYHDLFGGDKILDAARRMVEFEYPLQMEDGAFPGGVVGEPPRASVFNSAQIVNGLLSYHRKTGDPKALDSARRACQWIVGVQEADGAWGASNCGGFKRVYDTKVDESLLDLHDLTGDESLVRSARRNLEWVLGNQRDNGWFENCDNSERFNHTPLNHTLGYTIQGLIECHLRLKDARLLEAAREAADPLAERTMAIDHLLEGRFDSSWQPAVSSADVVGDAQLSICWQHLFEITGEKHYREAAFKMNRLLKSVQYLTGPEDLRGAVPCSFPFWGTHVPWGVTSWGVKYYTDALLREYKLRSLKA